MSSKTLMSVRIDLQRMAETFGAMQKEADLAGASVINRALMRVRTVCIQEIANTTKVSPLSVIRKRFRITKARPAKLVGALRILVGDISVSKLAGVRDTGFSRTGRSSRKWPHRKIGRGGLRAAAGRGVFAYGGRSYPHAFIAEGLGGNTLVFQRKGRSRFPLEAIKVPICEVAKAVIMRQIVEARDLAVAALPKEVARRIIKRFR